MFLQVLVMGAFSWQNPKGSLSPSTGRSSLRGNKSLKMISDFNSEDLEPGIFSVKSRSHLSDARHVSMNFGDFNFGLGQGEHPICSYDTGCIYLMAFNAQEI